MSSIPFSDSTEIVIQPYVREAASKFFASKEGRILLDALAAGRPSPLAAGPIDQVALSSASASGYELVFQNLALILNPPRRTGEKPSDNYPDLDDDSKWVANQT